MERMEWRGTGGWGFGEHYWLVGQRAVESDLGGIFGCGGGRIFARWEGGFGGANGVEGDRGEGGLGNIIG